MMPLDESFRVNINPKNPLLYRHWLWVRSATQGVRYLYEWSTAYNEYIIPLDDLPDHKQPLKSWQMGDLPGMHLERGSRGSLKIKKNEINS
jgi:hypothetical protein